MSGETNQTRPIWARVIDFPFQVLAIGLITIYRYTLSAFVGRSCRHLPSCSEFTRDAIWTFGFWAGGWIGVARIWRCRPGGSHGYDPIPESVKVDARWYLPWRYGSWRQIPEQTPSDEATKVATIDSDIPPIAYFDGHNDVLLRLSCKDNFSTDDFLVGDGNGCLDVPRMKTGGMVGGLFAVFAPPNDSDDKIVAIGIRSYPPLSHEEAEMWWNKQTGVFNAIIAEGQGNVAHCLSSADISSALSAHKIAMVLHVEGAEVIAPDLSNLDKLFDQGLRSIGPVWSRSNAFAHGVPFAHNSSPDIGDGLTAQGFDLIRACNAWGMMIDLSHLNEKGFWDVARISMAPLVASHSNVHAISPSSRNLTDKQLDAIAESDGLVGLNFAPYFLRPDGKYSADADFDVILRHLDHLIERLGENHVGFGSDYDGARMPKILKDVTKMPAFLERLRDSGYSQELLQKLGAENWLNLLQRTLK